MINLVALDLDGTLTQHKSKIESECREILTELSKRYQLVMVCAGGCERVYRQMEAFPIDIIGFYGMECSTSADGRLTIVDRVRIETDRAQIIDKIGLLRKELGFPNYDGASVEFHDSGVITFPLIGTAAPLFQKLMFDPDRVKRRRCYERVCQVFDAYNVFVGGSSSFDLVPKPYRKRYALEQYLNKNGIDKSEVIYFGDDCGFGGNDSDIYHASIKFIIIDNYRDFPRIAKEVLL